MAKNTNLAGQPVICQLLSFHNAYINLTKKPTINEREFKKYQP